MVFPFLACLYDDPNTQSAMATRFGDPSGQMWPSPDVFYAWAIERRHKDPRDQAMNMQGVLEWYFENRLGM